MPPKKTTQQLEKEINELGDGTNNALFAEDEPKPEQPKTEEPKPEEPKKEEPKKEDPEKNPLMTEIIDEKSRAEAEEKAAKEAEEQRKAAEKEEAKKNKEAEKAKKKAEKARKKAEEAELARRMAESDAKTYEDLPPNPGFWRTIASFFMKLLTGTGLKDVEEYHNARNKAQKKAEEQHKQIETKYKKELAGEEEVSEVEKAFTKALEKTLGKNPNALKQNEPEKTEPEKKEAEKTEPEKKEAEKKEDQRETNAPEKEAEAPQKKEPEKKQEGIDLTTHGEVKQDEGEKKDLEKMTPEERANVRAESFIRKSFPDKGKNLTPTQKENIRKVFSNAEAGKEAMQKNLDETLAKKEQFVEKPGNNMRDMIAGEYLEQYVGKHPERTEQLLKDMEKPNFAENLARSTNNNLNVYFLSQSKLNAESMKAYLSGGDKLKNVVDTLDRAIEDKRNSPTFREDVKSAQDKLKNQVEIQKKKIEEKERKLNDATMDKEKLDHTITQKMVV